jgi:hypothetical protein
MGRTIHTVGTRRRCGPQHQLAMIRELAAEGLTDVQLAERVGLGAGAVAHWRRQLRALPDPPIYVEGWAPDSRGRPFTPVWRWGHKPDAERNGQSITPAERMRNLRAARKGGES